MPGDDEVGSHEGKERLQSPSAGWAEQAAGRERGLHTALALALAAVADHGNRIHRRSTPGTSTAPQLPSRLPPASREIVPLSRLGLARAYNVFLCIRLFRAGGAKRKPRVEQAGAMVRCMSERGSRAG